MSLTIIRDSDRGHIDHGWLQAAHSFSFGHYSNPERTHFGALLVLNEDRIAPGAGFAEHFHDNMEIITIPLAGALAHGDSMGNSSVIRAGDVQIMSAGTGIMHSERNASDSEPVHLLQIWIVPHTRGLPTRYEQKTLSPLARNAWIMVAAGKENASYLTLHQDASLALGTFDQGQTLTVAPDGEQHGVFCLVLAGSLTMSDTDIHVGDAFTCQETIHCTVTSPAQLLKISVPMNPVYRQ